MARHAWPQLKNLPTLAALAALSRFASSQTIMGSEPPSSSVVRFRSPAAMAMSFLPVGVEPVKAILRTRDAPRAPDRPPRPCL